MQWNCLAYRRLLLTPACLVYLAVTLVPDNPEKTELWGKYVVEIRARFFGGLIVFGLIMSMNATLTAGMPLYSPMRVVHLCVVLLGVAGLLAKTRVAHKKACGSRFFVADCDNFEHGTIKFEERGSGGSTMSN